MFFAINTPASAQIEPMRVAPDGLDDRVEFMVPDSQFGLTDQSLDMCECAPCEMGSFAACGQPPGDCPPGWRLRTEALLLQRLGLRGLTLVNAHAPDDFGFEQGTRVSLVRHWDCLDAWEVSFMGGFEWNKYEEANGVGLNSLLNSTTVNLSEFSNATLQSQTYQSHLHSMEVNHRWYGWDVISTSLGVRYLNVGEDYLFNSTGAAGTGVLSINTDNQMIGPQVGMELLCPIGRWTTSLSFKGALLSNRSDLKLSLLNAGAVEIYNKADDRRLAGLFEFGYRMSYQVTSHAKIHAGVEYLRLFETASVREQLADPITIRTGSRMGPESNTTFRGASLGLEIVW